MAKGSEFERQIAKKMSLWWSNNKRDDIFYRTHASGARHTSRMKKKIKTENSAGDLMYIDEMGKPFIDNVLVEIKRGYSGVGRISTKDIRTILMCDGDSQTITSKMKNYITRKLKRTSNTVDLLNFIDSKSDNLLFEWYEKADKEREEALRNHVMIILRRDNKSAVIVLDSPLFNYINGKKLVEKHIKVVDNAKMRSFYILDFENFLEKITPKLMLSFFRRKHATL